MEHANQMPIETVGHELATSISLPGSKSISNRVLLLAALADGVSTLTNIQISDDTLVFIQALRHLGFDIVEIDGSSCVVTGSNGTIPNDAASVWCGSAGTASRFLLAAAGTGTGVYHFDATAQMKRRPMHTLIEALTSQGVQINSKTGTFPLEMVSNGLVGGPIRIDASESSQFTSAMLMAAPFAISPMEVEADVKVSRPYIDMTMTLMAQYGVEVNKTRADLFAVPNSSGYKARDYAVEPDASTASYFAAAAAVVGGSVTVVDLPLEGSLQGDTQFLRVLESMGCKLTRNGTSTTIRGSGVGGLKGVTVDMGDISDTMMTLACVAPYADTPTTIENIAHVRGKESDRVHSVAVGLSQMGIHVEETQSSMTIFPGIPVGATIDAFGDHRIAMAFSIMGLTTPGVVIDDYTCVAKTCPEFFTLLQEMTTSGGQA